MGLFLGLIYLFAGAIASQNPFASAAPARVFVFVRTDCPITNRYAPELRRVATEFESRHVQFWLVYPDSSETDQAIETHISEYHLAGTPLRDPNHTLQKRCEAKISPQAAVFDKNGKLVYSGRIDDRYVAFGKSRPEPTTHDLEDAISATLAGKPIAEPRTHAIGCYLADVQ